MHLDDGDMVGGTVRGQAFDDSRVDKVYEIGSHEWIFALFLAVLSVGWLVCWALFIARPWLRRRA